MNQYCGTTPILESELINIPNAKKCRENHGLVTAVPREDVFKRSKFLLDKREEYKDDKLLSKFLTSDKSDEYKYLIINLLETDYRRFTYDGPKKDRERIYNKELAIKLDEINYKKFNHFELMELAKNLWIKNYSSMSKQKLIEQIELVKKQFQK